MRILGLAALLAFVACSSSGSGQPGALTPENASLIAHVAPGAPKADVLTLTEEIGSSGSGVARVGTDAETGIVLLAFRAEASQEQRRAVFGRFAATGYFSSIQCSSCSTHGSQPTSRPSR